MGIRNSRTSTGFSLIELVIVVVIIGIIAAIAIPRISRGSEGAGDSALRGDLAVLRNAIDLFATEHGGQFPSVAGFDAELTQFTDDAVPPTPGPKDSTHIYGPYIRKIPPLPVGTNKGQTGVADAGIETIGASGNGWFYNATEGKIQANLVATEVDAAGVAYNTF